MEINDLLKYGYLPKELPPPFNSILLGDKFTLIDSEWNLVEGGKKKLFRESNFCRYTIPKVGFIRRLLGIPNPLHYSEVVKIVCDHWVELENQFSKSCLSYSKPTIDVKKSRALITQHSFSTFKKSCIVNSTDRLFELKTDISRWYPSIYTHIIPWALHSKSVAKSRRSDDSLLGNKLDKATRKAQFGQTVGIPIGPDTSLVISEIIGCYFDHILTTKFDDLKGGRFYDDYYLYFKTYSDAEKVLKYLQSIFGEHLVEINEEKTVIQQLPYEFEKEWAIILSNYQIRSSRKGQLTDLINYTSLCFKYAGLFSRDSVIKYGVLRFESIEIANENWITFESLLLKMLICETSIFPEVLKIFLTYDTLVDKTKLKTFLEQIIFNHINKSHNYEVVWALWFAKSFSIMLESKIFTLIIDSSDYLSKIIFMDLYTSDLVDKTTCSIDKLKNDLIKESLFDERWLFAYETVNKKWLAPKDPDIISSNEYFKILAKYNIVFYDPLKQIEKIKFPTKKVSAISVKEILQTEGSENYELLTNLNKIISNVDLY